MGVLDEIKKAGSAVSEGAARVGKLSQEEIEKRKLKSLQDDVAAAQQETGTMAYDLVERGEVSHPALAALQAKISEAQALVADREAEIAALKAEAKRNEEPSSEIDVDESETDSEA